MSGRESSALTRRVALATLCAAAWPRPAFAAEAPFADRFVTFDPPVPMSSAALMDRQAHRVPLAARRGRALIVAFWATWCPACRTDLPKLALCHQTLGRRGIDVAAVNVEEAPLQKVLSRAAELKTGPLPLYFDPGGRTLALALPDGRRSAFQPFGMPITFFSDRGGFVRGYVKGSLDWSGDAALQIADWL